MADITITAGNRLDVTYDVENTGGESPEQTVALTVDGVERDTDSPVVVGPADTRSGILRWNTTASDAVENATAEVAGPDSADTFTVTVTDPNFYGFESGDVSRWDVVNDLTAVTDRVFEGTYAGKCSNAQSGQPQAYVIPSTLEFGSKPSQIRYYWQETSNQSGSGVRLFNSGGGFEIGFATDNPQWVIEDTNGFETVRSNFSQDYDKWVRVTFKFDWPNGEVTINVKDLTESGSTNYGPYTLNQNQDIERIQIDDYQSNTWQTGGAIDSWFDSFEVTP